MRHRQRRELRLRGEFPAPSVQRRRTPGAHTCHWSSVSPVYPETFLPRRNRLFPETSFESQHGSSRGWRRSGKCSHVPLAQDETQFPLLTNLQRVLLI